MCLSGLTEQSGRLPATRTPRPETRSLEPGRVKVRGPFPHRVWEGTGGSEDP